jgi:hypothetical protein
LLRHSKFDDGSRSLLLSHLPDSIDGTFSLGSSPRQGCGSFSSFQTTGSSISPLAIGSLLKPPAQDLVPHWSRSLVPARRPLSVARANEKKIILSHIRKGRRYGAVFDTSMSAELGIHERQIRSGLYLHYITLSNVSNDCGRKPHRAMYKTILKYSQFGDDKSLSIRKN